MRCSLPSSAFEPAPLALAMSPAWQLLEMVPIVKNRKRVMQKYSVSTALNNVDLSASSQTYFCHALPILGRCLQTRVLKG